MNSEPSATQIYHDEDQKWLAAREQVCGPSLSYLAARNHLMPVPDFFCIGAQKAGTSWLYQNLRNHPLIWLPPIKEIDYFTSLYIAGHRADNAVHRANQLRDALEWWENPPASVGPERREAALACLRNIETEALNDDWYSEIFSSCGVDQLCGDISPEYSLLPRNGIRHACNLNPNLSVIILLRDPADRALSHARMLAGRNCTPERVWEVIKSDSIYTLMAYSDYPRWINRWAKMLGPDRIIVEFLDDIAAAPLQVLHDVCQRLGLAYHPDLFQNAGLPVFEGPKLSVDEDEFLVYLRGRLDRIYVELAEFWPEIARRFDPSPTAGVD